MTRGTIDISGELDKKFVAYCRRRREERGKVIQSATAIRELLEKALSDVVPEAPLKDRVTKLESDVAALADTVWRLNRRLNPASPRPATAEEGSRPAPAQG